jgi:hypothetical protein
MGAEIMKQNILKWKIPEGKGKKRSQSISLGPH